MKTLVFTFDDACASHFDMVRPLFKEYGQTGTFFVTALKDKLWSAEHGAGRNYPEMAEGGMSWEQAKIMHDEGFEIGHHTYNHSQFHALSQSQQRQEMESLTKLLFDYGIPAPVTFCYPGYHASRECGNILSQMGMRFARIGYLTSGFERGVPPGGRNTPRAKDIIMSHARRRGLKGVDYYTPGETNPMLVNSTGIFNPDEDEYYDLDRFISDLEGTPEGSVAVFTAHGFAKRELWDMFVEKVKYVSEKGHKTICFRDMPLPT